MEGNGTNVIENSEKNQIIPPFLLTEGPRTPEFAICSEANSEDREHLPHINTSEEEEIHSIQLQERCIHEIKTVSKSSQANLPKDKSRCLNSISPVYEDIPETSLPDLNNKTDKIVEQPKSNMESNKPMDLSQFCENQISEISDMQNPNIKTMSPLELENKTVEIPNINASFVSEQQNQLSQPIRQTALNDRLHQSAQFPDKNTQGLFSSQFQKKQYETIFKNAQDEELLSQADPEMAAGRSKNSTSAEAANEEHSSSNDFKIPVINQSSKISSSDSSLSRLDGYCQNFFVRNNQPVFPNNIFPDYYYLYNRNIPKCFDYERDPSSVRCAEKESKNFDKLQNMPFQNPEALLNAKLNHNNGNINMEGYPYSYTYPTNSLPLKTFINIDIESQYVSPMNSTSVQAQGNSIPGCCNEYRSYFDSLACQNARRKECSIASSSKCNTSSACNINYNSSDINPRKSLKDRWLNDCSNCSSKQNVVTSRRNTINYMHPDQSHYFNSTALKNFSHNKRIFTPPDTIVLPYEALEENNLTNASNSKKESIFEKQNLQESNRFLAINAPINNKINDLRYQFDDYKCLTQPMTYLRNYKTDTFNDLCGPPNVTLAPTSQNMNHLFEYLNPKTASSRNDLMFLERFQTRYLNNANPIIQPQQTQESLQEYENRILQGLRSSYDSQACQQNSLLNNQLWPPPEGMIFQRGNFIELKSAENDGTRSYSPISDASSPIPDDECFSENKNVNETEQNQFTLPMSPSKGSAIYDSNIESNTQISFISESYRNIQQNTNIINPINLPNVNFSCQEGINRQEHHQENKNAINLGNETNSFVENTIVIKHEPKDEDDLQIIDSNTIHSLNNVLQTRDEGLGYGIAQFNRSETNNNSTQELHQLNNANNITNSGMDNRNASQSYIEHQYGNEITNSSMENRNAPPTYNEAKNSVTVDKGRKRKRNVNNGIDDYNSANALAIKKLRYFQSETTHDVNAQETSNESSHYNSNKDEALKGYISNVPQKHICPENNYSCIDDMIDKEFLKNKMEKEKMDGMTKFAVSLFLKENYNQFFKEVTKSEYPEQYRRLLRRLWEDAQIWNYHKITGIPITPELKQQIIKNRPHPPSIQKL